MSSDWQWYTLFGALERRLLDPDSWSRRQRERILRVAGNPAEFGAPEPDVDLRVAGLSLCQDYLHQVRDGSISCRPAISGINGREITFADGSADTFDVAICATGYELDVPFLDASLWRSSTRSWTSTSGRCIPIFRRSASSASFSRRDRTSPCSSSRRA